MNGNHLSSPTHAHYVADLFKGDIETHQEAQL